MLSTNTLTRLQALQPDITSQLENIIQLAPKATDASLLALCSDYIDAALRRQHWSPPERALTDREQAFIAFTEQFTSSVGTMSDEQVDRLLQFSSADEVYAFINAIYVTDMSLRLELVAGSVLT
jgi:alkylhydroperoxidase family enzyme